MDKDIKNENTDEEIISEDLDDSVVAEESVGETIKKLREKLKLALAEKQEYLTNWQKDKADFLNIRKRDKEERENFIKFSNENLIGELLPVIQSFNMAMGNTEVWEKVDKNWRAGVEHIANQLKGALENNGLKELNPIGEKFDPMRDEALEYVPVTDRNHDHKIITVVQKGYTLNDKNIVAPKVKVGEYKKEI